MIAPLDVFSVNDDPKWLGCAETLEKALMMVCVEGVGSYCVFSQETGDKDYYKVDEAGHVCLSDRLKCI